MKKIVFLIILFFPLKIIGQITWGERLEIDNKSKEDVFTIIPYFDGVLGFRITPEKGFNLRYLFEFFSTDATFSKNPILEIPMKDYHDLLGYDIDGEYFYAFFSRPNTREKYLIKIDINNLNYSSIDLQTVINMEFQEFLVTNEKAIFAGRNDSRPIIQSFDLYDKSLYTFPEIFVNDMSLLHVRKIPHLNLIEALTSQRKRFDKKELALISYDEIGNKIRKINLNSVIKEEFEYIDAIPTPYQNLETTIVGTFGFQRKDSHLGNYILTIDDFGEQKITYYELKDYPNFYEYLEEKAFNRKQKELAKFYDKDQIPPIKPFLTIHQVLSQGATKLIHNETYTVTNTRNSNRDGRYYNNFSRFNQPFAFQNGTLDPNFLLRSPSTFFAMNREYKNIANHFALIHEDGRVIWENSLKTPVKAQVDFSPSHQISFDGSSLFVLTLIEPQIAVSAIKNGEVIFQNKIVDYQLKNSNERIKALKQGTLQLQHWYDHSFHNFRDFSDPQPQ
jgi:hypothetical protein